MYKRQDYTNDKQYNGEFVNINYIKNKFNNKSLPEIEAEIENIDTNIIIENALDYFIDVYKRQLKHSEICSAHSI